MDAGLSSVTRNNERVSEMLKIFGKLLMWMMVGAALCLMAEEGYIQHDRYRGIIREIW